MYPTRRSPSPRRAVRLIATLAAAVLTAGTVALVATPAYAAPGDANDPNLLGALTLNNTSGTSTDTPPFSEVSTQAGCPVGHQVYSRTLYYFQSATRIYLRSVAIPRPDGHPSLTAGTIALAGGEAHNETTMASTVVWNPVPVGGVFRVLLTCESTMPGPAVGPNAKPLDDAKYFSAQILKTSDTTWEVVPAEGPGEEKTDTTTTLIEAGTTATSTTLTATVAPAAAAGNVVFTGGSLPTGGTSVAVTGGVATLPVTGLTAATAYNFTANYSGDTTHEASTGTVTVTTPAAGEPADTASSELELAVPPAGPAPGAGSLRISTAPAASIPLTGGARTEGQDWTATGALTEVTVTDDRGDAAAQPWSLNGTASNFSGPVEIAGANLSWTPVKVSGAGDAGTPGPVSTNPLATGAASASANVATTVRADLSLTVPSSAPAGNYTSTLTLTLI